jgi:hypothetical protein
MGLPIFLIFIQTSVLIDSYFVYKLSIHVNVSIIIVNYCKMQSGRKAILTTFSSDLRFALRRLANFRAGES